MNTVIDNLFLNHVKGQEHLETIENVIREQFDKPLGIDPFIVYTGGDLKITTTKSFMVVRQDGAIRRYRKHNEFEVTASKDGKWEAHTVSEHDTGRFYIIFLRKA